MIVHISSVGVLTSYYVQLCYFSGFKQKKVADVQARNASLSAVLGPGLKGLNLPKNTKLKYGDKGFLPNSSDLSTFFIDILFL